VPLWIVYVESAGPSPASASAIIAPLADFLAGLDDADSVSARGTSDESGRSCYSAELLIEAVSENEAVLSATAAVRAAAATAKLPAWPIVRAEAIPWKEYETRWTPSARAVMRLDQNEL
jgi:hypothetical protein